MNNNHINDNKKYKIINIINIKVGGNPKEGIDDENNLPFDNDPNKTKLSSSETFEYKQQRLTSELSKKKGLVNEDSETPFTKPDKTKLSSNEMVEDIEQQLPSEPSEKKDLDSETPFSKPDKNKLSSSEVAEDIEQGLSYEPSKKKSLDNEDDETPFNSSIIISKPKLELEEEQQSENQENDKIINTLDKDTISKINNINIIVNKIGNETTTNNQQINYIKSNLENVTKKIDLINNLEENIKNIFNCSDKKSIIKEDIISDKISTIHNFLIQNENKRREELEINEKANLFKSKINEYKNESFIKINKDLNKFDLVLQKLARLSKRNRKIKYNKINNDNIFYELKYIKYKYKYLEYKKNNNFI